MTDGGRDSGPSSGDGADDPDTFPTVERAAGARFEVRGSTFVGRVAPVDDVGAAEAFVDGVRADHPDATHHVPAYRVPADGDAGLLREWASDDGEPAGSAGKPALNVLKRRDLRNVAAVVVRYFGGVKLGVGGLARAYARGVNDAVAAAGTVESVPHERFAAVVDYDDSGTVRSILESEDLGFDADYGERVAFAVRAPADRVAALCDRLRSATSDRVELDR